MTALLIGQAADERKGERPSVSALARRSTSPVSRWRISRASCSTACGGAVSEAD